MKQSEEDETECKQLHSTTMEEGKQMHKYKIEKNWQSISEKSVDK